MNRQASCEDFELEHVCQDGVTEVTIHLVHEAKKLAGAKVMTVR